MPDAETLIAWYGTAAPVPETRRLVAGPLTADLVEGNLRAIRFGGVEVLRAVAYVVRDADWGTYAADIADLRIAEGDGAFEVGYRGRCVSPAGATLRYRVLIRGAADGSLAFEAEAVAEGGFETNRCGFCVLHPIRDLAGRAVTVEHVDGTVERTRMPDLIAPWQPFKDMRALTHEVSPGLSATCRMEGDTFEMEDQRNWSDASFKTYVRPLALPWPYRLPDGTPQSQAVRLALGRTAWENPRDPASIPGSAVDRGAPPPAAASPGAVALALGTPAGTMPGIGLVVTPEETPATMRAADRLREAAPQSLLLHFDPLAGHGIAALRGFARVRDLLDAEAVLECVLPGRDAPDTELEEIAALVGRAGLRLDAIAVGPAADRQSTPPGSDWPACPPLADVYDAARRAFPGVRLGGGMFSTFTELNRKRPPVEMLDFVTHTTNPIVHAADDGSVMQTLETLPHITRSCRAIVGGRPYRIGPSTIGMRQNPYGSRTMDNPDGGRVCMARRDPRQRGLFAAAWLLGYAAQTAGAALETLTVGAPTGDFGFLDPEDEGRVRPLFHVVRGLAALAGRVRIPVASSDEDRVLGVAALDREGRPTLWIANLTDRPQEVRIASGADWRCAVLDADALDRAARGRFPEARPCRAEGLDLPPYAAARLRPA